tara:strand:+ start:478 stop:735 length:258 start_codon:yes stop_codon:yes gene_type:complete
LSRALDYLNKERERKRKLIRAPLQSQTFSYQVLEIVVDLNTRLFLPDKMENNKQGLQNLSLNMFQVGKIAMVIMSHLLKLIIAQS